MPSIEVHGRRLHYRDKGNGEPLILLHNGFDSAATWDALRGPLARAFRVVDYDREGYGASERFTFDRGEDLIEAGVRELEGLLSALGLRKASFIGHCVGGAIALEFARRHPTKAGRVVAEAVGYSSDAALAMKCEFVFRPFDRLDASTRERLKKMHGDDYAVRFWEILCAHRSSYIMNERYDILESLREVRCPVLVVSGDRDFFFGAGQSARAHEVLRKSELWILPDTGHDPHREHREEFLAQVRRFYKK